MAPSSHRETPPVSVSLAGFDTRNPAASAALGTQRTRGGSVGEDDVEVWEGLQQRSGGLDSAAQDLSDDGLQEPGAGCTKSR
jgi:hypothetical protein